MPALNFSVFVDKVRNGEKKQTIRRYTERKYKMFRDAIGKNNLMAFVGMGSSTEELIYKGNITEVIRTRFAALSPSEREELARKDGFDSAKEMLEWFHDHYLPKSPALETLFLDLMIIRWE